MFNACKLHVAFKGVSLINQKRRSIMWQSYVVKLIPVLCTGIGLVIGCVKVST
ncbi:hypothetical protein [Wolbachia endosymbiont of Ctenocephalides felis wCfeJ]|uniref:hypothetical protein n=1 Tax=Wolbachia endosymbiont of Ctenocephalides felis wCfeJ TaxID=2732594 RepID=UPI001445FA37|nr:hypothetical protein [Wolbachia endosymbiont of Ctenocephalides felis wCfeJ]WCR58088.1 MAG: hypothetical protein PG980_000560 [Wolbachia endosymbiont of Ctenocephalides felis wCfeJ]